MTQTLTMNSTTTTTLPPQRLVVFWEGTGNTLNPLTTQIGLFARHVVATDISNSLSKQQQHDNNWPLDQSPLKLAFDGCGVTHGNLGMLFAAGLNEQVASVVQIVEQLLLHQQQQSSSSSRYQGVHVVAVGLSRGGMACMKLAQQLAHTFVAATDVTISLLLFDPVPGNAIATGFPWTARGSADLRRCHNLLRVLALYPYEALPDLALHAPTLCRYPSHTLVQQDVCLGCHQGALFFPTAVPSNPYDVASNLSMRRVVDFLAHERVACDFSPTIHVPSASACIQLCRRALRQKNPTTTQVRHTHDATGQRRAIVRHATAGSNFQWLNRHHQQLEQALEEQQQSPPDTSSTVAVFGRTEIRDKEISNRTSSCYLLDFDSGSSLWCF